MRHFLFLLAIIAALVMAPVSPEAGNILFLIAGGLALFSLRKADFVTFGRPIVWMPLLGLGLLGLAFSAGAGTIRGLEGLLPFAPILAIWPLIMLPRDTRQVDPEYIAMFSFIGTAGALAIALNEYLTTGVARAGASVANPIHFADVALLAGFLSLVGLIYVQSVWRYLFLSGPVLAALAATLSGTRGAVVALVLMAMIAVVLAGALRIINLRIFIAAGVVTAIALLIGFAAGLGQTTGVQRVMLDIADVLQTGLPTDASTAIRLSMYKGGVNAFMTSPIFGHGPFGFVDAAAAGMDAPLFVGAPHLHNDILDFAASAGILGLIAYGLFMLAPLVEVLRAPPSATRSGLLVVVSTLVVGHFVMGLTNAMFGILTVTVYFAAVCVIVGVLAELPRCSAKADTLAAHP
ncbi:O-antigen ligase family protein [Devosia neptuniae]|uniref:O-antigen ligase family protein n=1 Tax=Devosia neptuniae TaxID=191302 RepID=UPI0022AE7455|nr:O-antigen ligase family protein [Devosia neptuniae]MCZ4346758.1 O-antigen ligase family protein [Devosia neptuniae]|tara:strand:+ start:17990 stop:19207 length:1218 start_codon:yes stop_codon:yes gene_type:complete